jgi:signal transduction histidine kinase
LSVALSGLEGQPLAGERHSGSLALAPSETGLPFILSASAAARADPRASTRERVFLFGLVAAVLATLGATYGLYRVTTREIALAGQQADFVASVSHEFRTPLTSMRHLTEILVSGGITNEERRRHYYALLSRETERLHRLVDGLLTFGRMDVGAYGWNMEPADAADIVATMVEDFRREPVAAGREVTCSIAGDLPSIRADREALSRALWNLLENAVKYSGPGTPIRVFARSQGASLLVGVEDAGVGIPCTEQQRVFQKFVRGSGAARAGVGGVGLGLALVTRIVEAHGGSVRLESEPGRGSTFTLVLPCQES